METKVAKVDFASRFGVGALVADEDEHLRGHAVSMPGTPLHGLHLGAWLGYGEGSPAP